MQARGQQWHAVSARGRGCHVAGAMCARSATFGLVPFDLDRHVNGLCAFEVVKKM